MRAGVGLMVAAVVAAGWPGAEGNSKVVFVSNATGRCMGKFEEYRHPFGMFCGGQDITMFELDDGYLIDFHGKCIGAATYVGSGLNGRDTCGPGDSGWYYDHAGARLGFSPAAACAHVAPLDGISRLYGCSDPHAAVHRVEYPTCEAGAGALFQADGPSFSCETCALDDTVPDPPRALPGPLRAACEREKLLVSRKQLGDGQARCVVYDSVNEDILHVDCEDETSNLLGVIFDGFNLRLARANNICLVPEAEPSGSRRSFIIKAPCPRVARAGHWRFEDESDDRWAPGLSKITWKADWCLKLSDELADPLDRVEIQLCNNDASNAMESYRWNLVDRPAPCSITGERRAWNATERAPTACELRPVQAQAECLSGTYYDGTGCAACPVGTFQDLQGQDSCKACPQNTFQIYPGRTFCEPFMLRNVTVPEDEPVSFAVVFDMARCLHVSGSGSGSEQALELAPCSAYEELQSFLWSGNELRLGDGEQCFVPNRIGDGESIIAVDCAEAGTLQWELIDDDRLRWRTPDTDGNLFCINSDRAGKVTMRECQTNAQQRWRMRSLQSANATLTFRSTSKCIAATLASGTDLKLVETACNTNDVQQHFQFDGGNLIIASTTGCLVYDDDAKRLVQTRCETGGGTWTHDNDGFFTFEGKHCLRTTGGSIVPVPVESGSCMAVDLDVVSTEWVDPFSKSKCNPNALQDLGVALSRGTSSLVALLRDADAMATCVHDWRARGAALSKANRNLDPEPVLKLSDAVAGTGHPAWARSWMWTAAAIHLMPYPGEERMMYDRGLFTSPVLPPLPLVDSASEADLKAYKELFTDPKRLHTTCQELIKSMYDCGCGKSYNTDLEECTAHGGNGMTNEEYKKEVERGVTLAFCAMHTDMVGSGVSLELVALTAGCLRSRSGTVDWQGHDPRLMLEALVAVRDLATGAAKCKYTPAAIGREYMAVAAGLAQSIEDLRTDVAVVEQYGAISLVRIDKPLQTGQLDNLHAALQSLSVLEGISRITVGLADMMETATKAIVGRIDDATETTQAAIASLGELVFNSSMVLDDKAAERFREIRAALRSQSRSELKAAENVREASAERLVQLELTFSDIVARIGEESDNLKGAQSVLEGKGDALGASIEEFLNCQAADELNRLAKERMFAIFKIVAGAITAIAEVGAFVLSGGASSFAKAAVKAGTNAARLVGNAVRSPGRTFRSAKDRFVTLLKEGSTDLPMAALKNKDKILESIEKLGDELEGLGDIIELSAAETNAIADWRDAIQTGLNLAGALGVPGADGAATIMEGVDTIVNHEENRNQVKDDLKDDLKDVEETFKVVKGIVLEIAEFAATLLLEFYDIQAAESPPSAPSVAMSSSPTRWDTMAGTIIDLLTGADQYEDVLDAVAAGSDNRLLLGTAEVAVVKSMDVAALQLRASAGSGVAVTSPRRVLGGKGEDDSAPDCATDTYSAAVTALDNYDEYFKALNNVVRFGKAMRGSIVDLVEVSRETKVRRAEYAGHVATVASWSETVKLLNENIDIDSDDELRAAYAAFLDRMPAINRAVPILSWNAPNASLLLIQETQPGGKIREACAMAKAEQVPVSEMIACTKDPMDAVNKAVNPNEPLGSYPRDVADAVTNIRGGRGGPGVSHEVFRLPVGNLRDLRLRFGVNGIITRDTQFSLDLRDPDLDFVAELLSCGFNMYALNVVAILQNVTSEGIEYQVTDPLDGEERTTYTLSGPFVQTDSNDDRHVVVLSEPVHGSDEVRYGSDDSCEGRIVFLGNKDADGRLVSACLVRSRSDADFDAPVPLLSNITFKVENGVTDKINELRDAPDEENVQLSLFVYTLYQASGRDCDLGREPRVPGEEGGGDPEGQSNVALIAGAAAAGGVTIAALLVFAVKRRRSTRGVDKSIADDVACSKSSDNPAFAVKVDDYDDATVGSEESAPSS